jgi:hypothetical protein
VLPYTYIACYAIQHVDACGYRSTCMNTHTHAQSCLPKSRLCDPAPSARQDNAGHWQQGWEGAGAEDSCAHQAGHKAPISKRLQRRGNLYGMCCLVVSLLLVGCSSNLESAARYFEQIFRIRAQIDRARAKHQKTHKGCLCFCWWLFFVVLLLLTTPHPTPIQCTQS